MSFIKCWKTRSTHIPNVSINKGKEKFSQPSTYILDPIRIGSKTLSTAPEILNSI